MSTKKFSIVAFGGDYAGPEVMAEGLKVMNQVLSRYPDVECDIKSYELGGTSFDLHGEALLPEALEAAKKADAVLVGAVGGPKWNGRVPSVEFQSLGALRRELQLYGNLRPINFAAPSLVDDSPLKAEVVRGTDILMIRELTGGIYFGEKSQGDRAALDTDRYTYEEVERVARLAGSLARQQRDPPLPVVSLDKANVLMACGAFWRRVVAEVFAAEFPDVPLTHQLADSAAMILACSPTKLNGVVLASNLFGDILSDQASVIAGSIGLLPSASLCGIPAAGSGMIKGLYEPIHGSAPDIAGKQVVNPIGMILSVAMMFRYSLGMPEAAGLIETAVRDTIEAGVRTKDMGGNASTKEIGDHVVQILSKLG
ncbi:Glucan 1,4-alpha-maltohexaosidase [Pyricularia oryzae]|nr:Glucan 1,4-alpha-maltohexaosidase [Pyricularia oryzae]KAI6277798.1 Glucan 1,4-alpha-maltohexaosidase [Pyricularia oryzae]KAI6313553.1 Glucan 1,4-alpha-maltohexaosidase [Pyricularia oryzae]KAI6327411.1 Glucan 1,4-alpha-maltohexaosidase [Pyricularia oryzae]KAI6412122.1 Glucan 1,4-alpha-maltohexaosidase [Pyricularia oryzae]